MMMALNTKYLARFCKTIYATRRMPCNHVYKLYSTNQEKAKGDDCSNAKIENELNIEALFLEKRVQDILKKVTGLNMNKVYRTRQKPLSTPTYHFLTDEQLQKLVKEAEDLAHEKLQMPPVMKERKPTTEVISDDPEIQGYDCSKYVFTDITYGVPDRKRIIVTRYPDGKLCHATWDQRHRMNCIYFPTPGRSFDMPRMFQDNYIEQVLNRHDYEFILDCACIQFDPDDPTYIKTTQKTYEHINETKRYEDLHSTRHYGPMVFHFAVTKNIDNLLLYLIQKVKIDDTVNLIKLYYIIHPPSKVTELDDDLNYIQSYIETGAKKKSALQLAIQTYKELYQNVLESQNSQSV